MHVRDARPTDDDHLGRILAATGTEVPTSLDAYLAVVSEQGRLLVAEADRASGGGSPSLVVGFGGTVTLDDGTTMVTDLFVDPRWHGRGVGGRILAELVAGRPERMTFSSQHPAALPSYRRHGMLPRWRLLTFAGTVALVPGSRPDAQAAEVDEASMAHVLDLLGRRALVDWYRGSGATVLAVRDATGTTGAAVVRQDAGAHTVVRLVSHGDPVEAMRAATAWLGAGARVRCAVPEGSAVSAWLLRAGFDVVDADVCASTAPEPIPSRLVAVHPGLC